MKKELYNHILTQVDYDPLSGDFTWNSPRAKNKIKSGDLATIKNNGVLKIKLTHEGKVRYASAHSLAYYIATGEIVKSICHRNGVKTDNRLVNLSTDPSDTSNDFYTPSKLPKGVSLFNGRYKAEFPVNGRTVSLGLFDTIEEAQAKVEQWTTDVDAYFSEEV